MIKGLLIQMNNQSIYFKNKGFRLFIIKRLFLREKLINIK